MYLVLEEEEATEQAVEISREDGQVDYSCTAQSHCYRHHAVQQKHAKSKPEQVKN